MPKNVFVLKSGGTEAIPRRLRNEAEEYKRMARAKDDDGLNGDRQKNFLILYQPLQLLSPLLQALH